MLICPVGLLLRSIFITEVHANGTYSLLANIFFEVMCSIIFCLGVSFMTISIIHQHHTPKNASSDSHDEGGDYLESGSQEKARSPTRAHLFFDQSNPMDEHDDEHMNGHDGYQNYQLEELHQIRSSIDKSNLQIPPEMMRSTYGSTEYIVDEHIDPSATNTMYTNTFYNADRLSYQQQQHNIMPMTPSPIIPSRDSRSEWRTSQTSSNTSNIALSGQQVVWVQPVARSWRHANS
jgi:hypothetical protein